MGLSQRRAGAVQAYLAGHGFTGVPPSAWARPTRPVPPSTPRPGRRSSRAWPRTGASRSCLEADVADDDDEIFDAEIIDDPDGELTPLVPPDTILTPCHHGCTCGLHQQVVYGERVPLHPPSELDHGEMALLVEAAGRRHPDAERLPRPLQEAPRDGDADPRPGLPRAAANSPCCWAATRWDRRAPRGTRSRRSTPTSPRPSASPRRAGSRSPRSPPCSAWRLRRLLLPADLPDHPPGAAGGPVVEAGHRAGGGGRPRHRAGRGGPGAGRADLASRAPVAAGPRPQTTSRLGG